MNAIVILVVPSLILQRVRNGILILEGIILPLFPEGFFFFNAAVVPVSVRLNL
jgi:hypothetical protein